MKGYKVFNPDWSCRGFKYEVGETYKMDEKPIIRRCGFHFCKSAVDCFSNYLFNPNNKVAEVEAVGEIDYVEDKCCTNKIKILREIPWGEVLTLVNIGHGCTGLGNSGNYNSGNRNSGNYNSGRCNSGDWNAGICNTGSYNAGSRNTGSCNTGNWNCGDWNCTDHSTGCFNTEMGKIRFFNKPSNWTLEDWWDSAAYEIMLDCPIEHIVCKSWLHMSDEEKREHPEAEIIGGYLTKEKADVQKWWDNLDEDEKKVVMAIPNFDADIFKECTGIEVRGKTNVL